MASTTLVLEDAGYFQDGTRGSDLRPRREVLRRLDRRRHARQHRPDSIDQLCHQDDDARVARDVVRWGRGLAYRKSDGARVLLGAGPDFGASEVGDTHPPANVEILK